jgi:pimeloyl-ACP methyl ester carboxylesterase
LYENQGSKVTVTGHSLGGGLALHMSFKYPNIDAIVFNSSPVTKAGLTIQKGNNRITVWESGEFLQGARNFISLFRSRWHPIRRIEFRFVHGWTVKQHGMELFALNITKLGATWSPQLKALTESWVVRDSNVTQQTIS